MKPCYRAGLDGVLGAVPGFLRHVFVLLLAQETNVSLIVAAVVRGILLGQHDHHKLVGR